MNAVSAIIREVLIKDQLNGYDNNKVELEETILVLAFYARKGILDRLERNNWPITMKIAVPTINKSTIQLSYALDQTVGRLYLLVNKFNMAKELDEIFNRGPLYYIVEKLVPEDVRKNLSS